jgi:uncharacterized SAM-binding protein YcdF (DUF218 family)
MALTLAAIAVAVLITALWDFARRMASTAEGLPAQAAVFTGHFARIQKGLDLLDRREIKQLLVSGVNRESGIMAVRFASQFELEHSSREALSEGRLVLGPVAKSTLENVSETLCWLESRGLEGPVLLITSARHMPRASVALENAMPNRQIRRLSVSDGAIRPAPVALEFLKYLATLAIIRMPLVARRRLIPDVL